MKKENNVNKKIHFKNLIIPILILLIAINFVILTLPNKEEKQEDKIVSINDLGVVITKNGKYYLELENTSLINKYSYLEWSSSDSKIIDVSSCNHKVSCYLTPSDIGEVSITINYNDKKNKKSDSDTVYISVIESEVINFYQYEGKIYVDKLSQNKYSDLENYQKKASYTCKDVDCQFITGEHHAIIKDSDYYINVDIGDINLNSERLNSTIGCKNVFCNTKYEANIDFSTIKALVDSYSKIEALIIGDDKTRSYTGVYSLTTYNLKEISFKNYTKIINNDYDLMLYDYEKDYLYSTKTDEVKTINFGGTSMGRYQANMIYYYLSKTSNDYNRNCVILDSNYNFLFNSKVFDYALIVGNNLYTYDIVNGKKIPNVYNLDGNEIKNYFDENFEIYGYFFGLFAIGKLNNKVVVINIYDKKVVSELSVDLSNYPYGVIMIWDDALTFISNNKFDSLDWNECILHLYDDSGQSLYIRYGYSPVDKKISSKILSVKEVNN